MTDIVNSPDALISDPDSKVFYVLRNEELMICKTLKELPYWQNRSTYLSAGRFSPEYKKVVFYPDPVNPSRAMHLLKEHGHIEEDYSYAVAGSTLKTSNKTGVFGRKPKSKEGLENLDELRKREVEVLMQNGMRRQVREDNSEKDQVKETSD